MKKLLSVFIACLMCFFVAGCSQSADNGAGKTYSDEEFLSSLGEGLQARWEKNDSYYQAGIYERSDKEMTAMVDAELEHVRKYEKATLSDEKLTDLAHEYIAELLNEQAAAKEYDFNNPDSLAAYSNVRDECVRILSQIIKDYKIPVEEKYEVDLKDILEEGTEYQELYDIKAALNELTSQAVVDLQQTDEGLAGTAAITNSTAYSFAYVDLEIHLYNENDEEVDYYYWMIRDWEPGAVATDEVRFFIDEMPARIEVVCEDFALARAIPRELPEGEIDEEVFLSPEDDAVPVVTSEGLIDPTTGETIA